MQNFEYEIVKFIQQLSRLEFVEKFFYYISFLGETYLFIIIALLIYWLIDKKWAYQFVTGFLASAVLVSVLKVIFKRPRPYQAYDDIDSIGKPAHESYGEHSYSFPSGHSQVASAITTGVMAKTKNTLVRVLMILNVILIPFSRIYLGQHYLSDVLVGILIGYTVVTLIYWLFSKTNKEEVIGVIIVPFVLVAVYLLIKGEMYNKEMFQAAGAFTAFALGYYFEKKVIKFNPKDNRKWVQIIKFVIGLGVTFGLQQGLKLVLPYETVAEGASIPLINFVWDGVRYFIIALWVTVGATALFKLIFRTKIEESERKKVAYQEV